MFECLGLKNIFSRCIQSFKVDRFPLNDLVSGACDSRLFGGSVIYRISITKNKFFKITFVYQTCVVFFQTETVHPTDVISRQLFLTTYHFLTTSDC